jgi:hypothetical protein
MRLHPDDIDRIAQRVAAVLVEGAAVHQPARYVDAAALARTLGVERSWVYAHADELGAVRLGGPGGRLRFDLEDVRRRLPTARAVEVRRQPRGPGARPHRVADPVALIPYER